MAFGPFGPAQRHGGPGFGDRVEGRGGGADDAVDAVAAAFEVEGCEVFNRPVALDCAGDAGGLEELRDVGCGFGGDLRLGSCRGLGRAGEVRGYWRASRVD
jgi:hypothetical protein